MELTGLTLLLFAAFHHYRHYFLVVKEFLKLYEPNSCDMTKDLNPTMAFQANHIYPQISIIHSLFGRSRIIIKKGIKLTASINLLNSMSIFPYPIR